MYCVFSEVLRIHPPLPATGYRIILEDGVTVGDYNISKGCMPRINAAAIHRNPKYWIKDYDAEKHGNVNMKEIHLEFWMEDGVFLKKLQSDNFFTFHSGKRDCVGQALAMKELIIVLAMVFMKYTVEGPNGSRIDEIMYKNNGIVVEPTVSAVSWRHRK